MKLPVIESVVELHEIFISTDVEADGPIPGPHSMLSFGSAASWPDKTLVATFSANLTRLRAQLATPKHALVVENQDSWNAARTNCQPPEQSMPAAIEQGALFCNMLCVLTPPAK